MKPPVCILLFLFLSLEGIAQTQQGYVKTKGRLASNGTVIQGTRLSGAIVTVKGRNAVLSGSNGTFMLSIPGSSFYLQNVQKQGYVITDPDVLSRQYAYSKNPLVLVLEMSDQQMDDRLAAQKKIRRTLERQLREKEDEIELLKEQHKLSDEDYRKQLKVLYTQQAKNEDLISDMAERYSKIDFDEVNDYNRKITYLILEGKLIEADSLINTKGDINSRVTILRQHQEVNAQAEQELKEKTKRLEKSKAMTQQELEDLAQDCYSKYEIYKMQHQNDSAAYYVELRANLDSTNVDWNIDAGKFYEDYLVELDKSMSYYQRALNFSIKYNGENSISTACVYNNIGVVYQRQDNYDLAIDYMKKAIQIKKEIVGEQETTIATSYCNIGSIFTEKGDFSQAIKYLTLAEQIQLSNKSEHIHITYNSFGVLYYRQGDYIKALEYFQKSLRERIVQFGEKHQFVASIYGNIGSVYTKQANYNQALEHLGKALDIDLQIYGKRHPSIAVTYNNIGQIYENEKKYDLALEYYRKALSINEFTYGHIHTSVAGNYNNIGMVYSRSGQLSNALDYLQKAYYIDSLVLGDNNATVAMILNNIGGVYMKSGCFEKSLEVRMKAVEILRSCVGENHPNVGLCYNNIAIVFSKMKEFNQALVYFEKALAIFTSTLPNNHPNIRVVKQSIADTKEKIDNDSFIN